MKTLLLLGGSRQQVVAIAAAKRCGFRTVLCDYLPDNPGQHYADVFYQVSTTDREAVLKVAVDEDVDGVIAYSSDPASPTAAYVAEKLGLPTNPLRSVEIMSVKHLFRNHLAQAGLPCPQATGFKSDVSPEELWSLVESFEKPVVIKPTDSSGSKGVTVVSNFSQVEGALEHARFYSRNGVLIAEEYIEYGFPHVIGGDIFVVDGEVRFWGLMACLRDSDCALVPVGERMPIGIPDTWWRNIQEVLRGLVSSLDLRFGEFNVEIIMGKNAIPYVLELGSRAGGNMIPVQLSDASGIDLVEANVLCAMGEMPVDLTWEPQRECCLTYVLHSTMNGIFKGISLSDKANCFVYRKEMYKEVGDPVERFDGANKAIGILFAKFESVEERDAFVDDIKQHIQVLVEE